MDQQDNFFENEADLEPRDPRELRELREAREFKEMTGEIRDIRGRPTVFN
jgi:hypothetical protein